MDRIRRLSMEILERHRELFTEDYEQNKLTLHKVATIRSKRLRNQISGFITSNIKKEKSEYAERLAEAPVAEPIST